MNPSGTGYTGTTGQHQTTTAPMAGTTGGTTLPGPAPNTAGPHNNDTLNKVDPRVDAKPEGQFSSQTTTGTHGTHGTTGHTTTSGVPPTSMGTGMTDHTHNTRSTTQAQPVHNSGIANKMDPRVDTTTTGRTTGTTAGHTTGGTMGTGAIHPTTGAMGTETHRTAGMGSGVTHTGQHQSMVDQADPHVDTTHRHGAVGTTGHTGTAGHTTGRTGEYTTSGAPEGTHGTHNSRVANAADPRIDSDRDGSRTVGGHSTTTTHTGGHGTTTTHTGPEIHPGPAEKTAGPHKSDLLNKLDPRVDSKATVTEKQEYRTTK